MIERAPSEQHDHTSSIDSTEMISIVALIAFTVEHFRQCKAFPGHACLVERVIQIAGQIFESTIDRYCSNGMVGAKLASDLQRRRDIQAR